MATPELIEITNSNAKFLQKFYDILAKESPDENIFFSPLSAHTVLALAYQGAVGKTEECFAKALNVTSKIPSAKGYNDVTNILNSIEKVTLHTANKIFIMKNFEIKEEFAKTASDLFLSTTESVDFENNLEAAGVINKWVEDKTNKKIKKLIDSSALDGSTRLVLVNAIYFKGRWLKPFSPHATKVEPFYASNSKTVDCSMMHAKKEFIYYENKELDAKILQLPYVNKDVSMVIVLPNEKDGITYLENKLQGVDLTTLTNDCSRAEVDVALPKFKIETTMDLKNVLIKMGLGIIFDPKNADFSEMSDIPLYVSKVVQKAFIEVNEEGAEAAAATGLVAKGKCLITYSETYSFIADHPFLVLLQMCKDDAAILIFYGKLHDPVTRN